MNEDNGINVSIIIPTLNEVETLKSTLDQVFESTDNEDIEVIVSDGGSIDGTLEVVTQYTCNVISGASGRAAQMNRATGNARGRVLLFLHADTKLPDNWYESICESDQWGFFPLKLSGKHRLFRFIERAINLRSRLTGIGSGDQALFFSRRLFDLTGGYSDIPLMEDIAICKNARQLCRPVIPENPVITSSRRWETRGILRTVVLMWLLRLGYFVGLNPRLLHRIYYPPGCKS